MAKKSTTRKSPPQPSPLAIVLGHLVLPAFEAEAESGDEGSSFELSDPESEEAICIHGLIRGDTRRGASGRVVSSSIGSGKCQGVTRVPVAPPTAVKR